MKEHLEKELKIIATITEVKGHCKMGHQVDDSFEISCHKTGGLCGFFYYQIFPSLSTYQYGGKYPWWRSEILEFKCPDPANEVNLRLEKVRK